MIEIGADVARDREDLHRRLADAHVHEEVHAVGDAPRLQLEADRVGDRLLDALGVREVDRPGARERRQHPVRLGDARDVEVVERRPLRDAEGALQGGGAAPGEVVGDDDLDA